MIFMFSNLFLVPLLSFSYYYCNHHHHHHPHHNYHHHHHHHGWFSATNNPCTLDSQGRLFELCTLKEYEFGFSFRNLYFLLITKRNMCPTSFSCSLSCSLSYVFFCFVFARPSVFFFFLMSDYPISSHSLLFHISIYATLSELAYRIALWSETNCGK